MIFLLLISLVILLLYTIKINTYKSSWENYPEYKAPLSPATLTVSIVVAFRNEQENLPALLNSIEKQNYPDRFWEVILVDDHSTDLSSRIVSEFAALHPGFRNLNNEPGENGKKAAVLKGIAHASHKLIVTTDADCIMGEHWLETICGLFSEQDPAMAIGLVDMNQTGGFFKRFEETEFLGLIASGAAAAALGKPLYCSAANLAFKKELTELYPDPLNIKIPSGDDTLFMHRIKRNAKNKIVVLKSTLAVVTTQGAINPAQFMNQRIRWTSKGRHYTDRDTIYTAALVLAVSVVMAASTVSIFLGVIPWFFLLILAAKGLTDYFFLHSFMQFYGRRLPGLLFAVFEFIYPWYIIVAAIAGISIRYTWKDRRYK